MNALRWTSLLLLAAALLGCGGSEGQPDPSPESSAQDEAPAQSSETVPPTVREVTHTDALKVVKQSDAKITVVNFWATWCVPCVEEFPSFTKLDRTLDEQGVEVMFISTDFPNQKQKVADFLAEHGVTGTSYLKTGDATKFVNGFSEDWSGAVPATFIYDSDGTLLTFWEGKTSYEELKTRVTKHLDTA
jgi:thiol-disulfide isomerase/thioredoxin